MKPIRIFRHIDCEGPAYLQTLLEQRHIDFELIRIDAGDAVNADLSQVSGLLFMGGSMSANDPIDWIAQELRLIQEAITQHIPVMGVCLGSQLMARALGARVYPGQHACMELGWGQVETHRGNPWSDGLDTSIIAFHWHGETFSLPKGAHRLFSNDLYDNQGFVIGPHLALQFHLEMTRDSIQEWLDRYPEDVARRCESALDREAILAQIPAALGPMQQQAEILFSRWLDHCQTANHSP